MSITSTYREAEHKTQGGVGFHSNPKNANTSHFVGDVANYADTEHDKKKIILKRQKSKGAKRNS